MASTLTQNTIEPTAPRPIKGNADNVPAPVVASLGLEVGPGIKTGANGVGAIEKSPRPPARIIPQRSVEYSGETAPQSQDNPQVTRIGELWTIGVFR